MSMKNIFRFLVVVSILFPIIGMVWTEYSMANQIEEVQELQAWNGYGGMLWFHPDETEIPMSFIVAVGTALLLLLTCIVAITGLLFFKKWARTLMVIVTIVGFAFLPFIGVVIIMPISATLESISTVCFGALIAMAYLEPLKNEFV